MRGETIEKLIQLAIIIIIIKLIVLISYGIVTGLVYELSRLPMWKVNKGGLSTLKMETKTEFLLLKLRKDWVSLSVIIIQEYGLT